MEEGKSAGSAQPLVECKAAAAATVGRDPQAPDGTRLKLGLLAREELFLHAHPSASHRSAEPYRVKYGRVREGTTEAQLLLQGAQLHVHLLPLQGRQNPVLSGRRCHLREEERIQRVLAHPLGEGQAERPQGLLQEGLEERGDSRRGDPLHEDSEQAGEGDCTRVMLPVGDGPPDLPDILLNDDRQQT